MKRSRKKYVYLVVFLWANGKSQINGCFDSQEKAEKFSGYNRTNCIIQKLEVA